MAHNSLKKKVMAATVAMAMGLGTTTVVAPDAVAVTQGAFEVSNAEALAAYQEIDNAQAVIADNQQYKYDPAYKLIGTPYGAGWCIEAGNKGEDPDNFVIRKLTGQSGLYGDSTSIDPDIEKAAINVTKKLVEAFENNDTTNVDAYNFVLQALLGTTNTGVSRVRQQILDGVRYNDGSGISPGRSVSNAEFTRLTGFKVTRNPGTNMVLQLEKDEAAFNKMAANVKDGEYVTVLVPTRFSIPVKEGAIANAIELPQRYITVEQPGLNPKPKPSEEPTPEQPAPETSTTSTTSTTTKPAQPSTSQQTSTTSTTSTTTKPAQPSTSQQTSTTSTTSTTNKPSEPTTSTSTATTTRTEVSHVTEVVKKYEYHYTYIYNYQEYKSTINVSSNVSGSWNFEVKNGGELADVTKEDGKLVIKPKPGANGTVTIVVTDSNGQTYEYQVKVDYTSVTNVENNYNVVVNGGNTNNTSVTINLPSDGTHRVVSGGEWVTVEKQNGQLIVTPRPGSDGKTAVIEIIDGNGNVVNKVNVNITVNTTTQTDVKNIVTGGQIIIDNKGSYNFVKGGDLVNVEEKNGQLIITPKPNSSGQAVLVIRDEWGNKYEYTINVDTKVNVDTRTITLQNGGKSEITISGDWTHRVVSGGENVNVTKNGNTLVVEGVKGKNGQAVIEIVDSNGQVIGRYTFVTVTTTQQITTNVVKKSIDDHTDFSVTRGDSSNTLKIVEGGDLVNSKDENGTLSVKPKQGANGLLVIEERTADGQLLTRYEITITPAKIREVPVEITSDQVINMTGTDLVVTKGEELVDVTKSGKTWTFTPKEGANGQLVIEDRDSEGRTTVRYIVTVKPVQPKTTTINLEVTNTTSSGLNITIDQNSQYTVVEGKDKVDVTREGGQLVVKPKNGATGTVVIEVKNPDGTTTRYNIDIKQGNVPSRNVTIINTGGDTTGGGVQSGEFTVDVKPGNELEVVEGDKNIIEIVKNGDTRVITPKDGKSGTIVIVERDQNGNPINRYVIEIVGKTPTTDGQSGTITVTEKPQDNSSLTVKTPGNGGTITIKDGGKDVTGEYTIKDNGDGTWTIVRKDGKPLNGTLTITWTSPDGKSNATTGTITFEGGDKGNGGTTGGLIITDKDSGKGTIEITAPGKGGTITIKDGGKDVTDEFEIKDNGDGTWTLIRKDGKPLNGDLTITWTSPDGKTVTNNVNITVNTGSSNNREGGSSNPACVGAISLLSLPLLLAIPVGILSQVQIPGFEHISAQLNAAIQQANTEIQKGLGIFDQNRAGAAANVDEAAAQIAPLIGAGAAAVGALAVIAGVGAGVMHACGVVDLNEASSNGGSSLNGSSEK